MFVKVKGIFFGCCHASQVIDPTDVDKIIKLPPSQNKHLDINLKTEHSTLETQSNVLTTLEGEELVYRGPKLRLNALEGNIVPVNTEFLINGRGLESNFERKANGCVYIGRHKLAKDCNTIINDIVLDDPSVGEKHCMIKYNRRLKRYYLKDQGEGSGTFIKVEGEAKLRNGNVVSFSNSHMVVQLAGHKGKDDSLIPTRTDSTEGDLEKDTLELKFLDGQKAGETYKFSPEQGPVKIGRMNDCQIKFDGTNLSRYQCTIEYKDNTWYISDGTDGKQSTNGTWVFMETFCEVRHGTVLKIGQTLFGAEIINLEGMDEDKK